MTEDAETIGVVDTSGTLNVNVGVLGHVDSGKTSLVRALSTLLSTNALDKNPQSKARGITLDLGFSAFTVDEVPPGITGYDKVQYTLVDCPGHASLIRTIIGGAQIIDRMLLVVDITKGIQTQTAECLVIGEILTDELVVVLNKIDLLPEKTREKKIEQGKANIRKALSKTRFKDALIIACSAIVGGDGKAGVGKASAEKLGAGAKGIKIAEKLAAAKISGKEEGKVKTMKLEGLVKLIKDTTKLPQRNQRNGPLFFAVDHCFPIKGQGTVLTGTVLSGTVSVGDNVELPEFGTEKKIKTIQMFRKPVNSASQGDRAAMCVTNLNAKLVERGIVATPGSVPVVSSMVALVRKVRYFQKTCASGTKLHITVGHSTQMATVTFFGSESPHLKSVAAKAVGKSIPQVVDFDPSAEYKYDEVLRGGGKAVGGPFLHWCFVQFDKPVLCPRGSMLIGSRLDADVKKASESSMCRIALYGKPVTDSESESNLELSALKIFKTKQREGVVDRVVNDREIICKGLFKKETDMSLFIGKRISTDTDGELGVILGSFGKAGKFKVDFREGTKATKGDKIYLRFIQYMFSDASKGKLVQL